MPSFFIKTIIFHLTSSSNGTHKPATFDHSSSFTPNAPRIPRSVARIPMTTPAPSPTITTHPPPQRSLSPLLHTLRRLECASWGAWTGWYLPSLFIITPANRASLRFDVPPRAPPFPSLNSNPFSSPGLYSSSPSQKLTPATQADQFASPPPFSALSSSPPPQNARTPSRTSPPSRSATCSLIAGFPRRGRGCVG